MFARRADGDRIIGGSSADRRAPASGCHTAAVDSDRARWDERHRAVPDPVRPEPPEALALVDAGLLPESGFALDLACGRGAQSLWLARRGLRVTAIDVSPVAVDEVRRAAGVEGLAAAVDARVHDLDDGLPIDVVDGHRFDVVVCQRFRDRRLYPQLLGVLRVGGLGIVTVLSEVGLDSGPSAFHARAGELRAAFATGEVIAEREADGLASIVFRRR